MTEYKNFPFVEVALEAERIMQEGADVYQKFTCSRCGSRQTMEVPNIFHKLGKCEECSHVTDLVATGCNYMVHFKLRRGP